MARKDDILGTMNPFQFGIILYNGENHFEMLDNHFTAPSAGVYYFSFGLVGLVAHGTADFRFSNCYSTLFCNYNGNDTTGRSVMTPLVTGDIIQIGNFGGQTARLSSLIHI